jgi:hypothetical protein
VTRLLQPPQQQDLDHVPDMERARSGIEADIAGDDLLGGKLVQPLRIGQLVDVAAFVEQAQKIGFVLSHGAQALAKAAGDRKRQAPAAERGAGQANEP